MARYLAVEWSADGIRYLAADVHSGIVRVRSRGIRPISETDVAESVAEVIREQKATKSTVLLCIPSGAVETLTFRAPPAAESELPVIVGNLARRELTGATDETVVDLTPFAPDDNGSRPVAAYVPASEVQEALTKLRSLFPRAVLHAPVSAHSLAVFSGDHLSTDGEEGQPASELVICLGTASAQLVLLQQSLPIISRSMKLPPGLDSEESAVYLAAEIGRTLISVPEELPDAGTPQRVTLIGDDADCTSAAARLAERLNIRPDRKSPDDILQSDPTPESGPPLAEFVAAAGAVLTAAAGNPLPVDFLNPRRAPKPPNQLLRVIAAAAAAVLLIGGGWYYAWSSFEEIRQENARLKERRNELRELVKETRGKRNLATLLSAWEANRMSWLDEMRDLTERIPSAPGMTLNQLTMNSTAGGRIAVSFSGTSRLPDALPRMEANLRDQWHQLRTPGVREQIENKKPVWLFRSTMTVRPRSVQQFRTAFGIATETQDGVQLAASDEGEQP